MVAQTELVDSLKKTLLQAPNDTSKCYILSQLAENAPEGEWQEYNKQSLLIAEKNLLTITKSSPLHKTFTKYLSYAFMNIGTSE